MTFQQILKSTFILPITLICSTVFAFEPYQATYQVDYNGQPMGTAISTLKNTNAEWDYSFTASAGDFIKASAQSLFDMNEDTIQPLSFNRNTKIIFF